MASNGDEELDLTSSSFDPIKALYAKNVKMPSTSAQPLDNISRFELTPSGKVLIKPQRMKVILNYMHLYIHIVVLNITWYLQKENIYNVKSIKRDLSSSKFLYQY